ncbi:MAG TPA: DUF4190 domain-containing protein [Acidimicrobiales bacterium]|nr:DUF4190 domain-containing protein [Acidimicrobiales bacterium]
MSDTSQGPGWWLASDGKWYPPELWTGPPMSGPAFPQAAPNDSPGQAGGLPPTTGAPYGGQFPPQGYAPYAPYGGPVVKRNNGLAVASLVCSCAGFVVLIPAVLGIIFGFIARSQIRRSGGRQGGDGLAIAGIIVGFAWIAFFVILGAVNAGHNNTSVVVGFAPLFSVPGITA